MALVIGAPVLTSPPGLLDSTPGAAVTTVYPHPVPPCTQVALIALPLTSSRYSLHGLAGPWRGFEAIGTYFTEDPTTGRRGVRPLHRVPIPEGCREILHTQPYAVEFLADGCELVDRSMPGADAGGGAASQRVLIDSGFWAHMDGFAVAAPIGSTYKRIEFWLFDPTGMLVTSNSLNFKDNDSDVKLGLMNLDAGTGLRCFVFIYGEGAPTGMPGAHDPAVMFSGLDAPLPQTLLIEAAAALDLTDGELVWELYGVTR